MTPMMTMRPSSSARPRADGTISVELPIRRIRAEFEEMPGLSLTLAQASRLWNLTAIEAHAVLTSLVAEGFLVGDRRGIYRRRGCPRCS